MRYKSRSRALATSALAASLGLAGLGLVAPAAGAAPAETDRIAGQDRYETAADIADASYPDADTVVLTTGERLPDALSANPIAGAEDAPILLTLTDSIPASTQAALEGIDPTNVIIVGGTAAVSQAVEDALVDDGYAVTREAGVDRFETAAEVALEVGVAPEVDPDGAGSQPALPTVALANGLTGLPDAVAASPMLHKFAVPLLLTGPDTLNEDAAAAIAELGAEQVLVLGGTAAISNAIEDELEGDDINVERLAGTDRWGTAAAIADFEIDFLGFDAATTYIASGFSVADALAGGPLASQTNSPIVLVSETSVPAPTALWIEENAADIDEIIALGGTAVINDTVLAEAAELADEGATPSTGGAVTTQPELVSAAIVRTTSPTQVGPGNSQGLTVQYCFDEAVTGTSPVSNLFRIYPNDSASFRNDGVASIDPSNNKCVNVFFAGAQFDTPAEAAALTLATVDDGAVRDGAQQTNPEGDAPLGSGATTAVSAGVTNAPDLLSVGGFRQASTVDLTAVEFTFDEAAFVLNTTGFHLVLTNGDVVDCTAPAGNSTTAGGGTVPGGNGTTTITVTCNDAQAGQTPGNAAFIQASEVARGYVDEGAVADAATGGVTNALQAADVSNAGNSLDPDLVSAAFQPDSTANVDQVLYTFDEPVRITTGTTTTPEGTAFCVYYFNGTDICGAASNVAQRSPLNDTQVLVTFPDGSLTDAVGANVLPGAVQEITSAGNRFNEADEVAVTPTSSTTVTAGRTNGPDLLSVVTSQVTDAFGVTRTVATYVFDEDTTDTANGAGFHLYLSDGIRLDCAETTTLTTRLQNRTEDQDSTVTCAAFVVAGTATLATNTQVGNAVLGTVDHGVVVDETAGSPNPIGASVTVGGSGTPQQ